MNFEIKGGNFPVLECTLNDGEAMISQGGGMSWMSPNMEMKTSSNGGIGKMFGRMLTNESIFQNIYTARGGVGSIAFAASLPGEIVPLDIAPGSEYICQKSSFLASTPGVELSTYIQRKFGAGLLGGEGFVMQKLSGQGKAFVEVDGAAIRYNLQAGQKIIVDTGYVVLMSSSCEMSIQTVKGVKNALFGGEGFFNTVVTGPGEVVLQTMPTSRLAAAIQPYIRTSSN